MRNAIAVLASVLAWIPLGREALAREVGIAVDRSGYDPACGVAIETNREQITVRWPIENDETAQVVIDLREGRPLFAGVGIAGQRGERFRPIIENVDPVTFQTVGQRRGTVGRPPGMSEFNEFFDTPANRPSRSHASRLALKKVRVSSHGRRATVALGDLTAGPFTGEWRITVYPGARLIELEAVVTTPEGHVAFFYDAGLASESPSVNRLVWIDTEGHPRQVEADADTVDHPLAVRHRVLVGETAAGALACFPPPHQFFFPRDLTDNQQTVWYGRNHRGLDPRFGFGVRQTEKGGGGFVPWFNAPPGTEQHLGVFFLLMRGNGRDAIEQTLRYTNHDRFPSLPGYHTMTSHYHMAIAMATLQEKAKGSTSNRSTPDFVAMFKDMGVKIVHLAEFHGDGHPDDPGPLRLPELRSMYEECRRLSDRQLLLIPGEEINSYLGLPAPGRHPGHWMSLFPRPVYWTRKQSSEAFQENHPEFGTVYHVGSRADMMKLLEQEDGLAWAAHPRIKASSWTPDIFRHEDFYLSDHWLGGAWKAMPADLSHDRLGKRVLDLLDDMANWGQRKYVLGEVDVFKLDHTHELYGHMNINYVKLDRVPAYDEGWKSVLDALRGGRFFVSTGEVLIPEFSVGGKPSGGTLSPASDGTAELRARVRWTFPLRFAEVISGDGSQVQRQRIDLSDTSAFGEKELKLPVHISGRNWVRLEVWDIACNGAFTQPVWISNRNTR
jgi:hypothetical protein